MHRILKISAGIICFCSLTALALEPHIDNPPPPPKPSITISKEVVAVGERLFEENIFKDGEVEIHNYLGSKACAQCHDSVSPLHPEALAKKFRDFYKIINSEIVKNCQGKELPLQDPALEALSQYLIQKYRLNQYKLLK